MCPVFEHDSGYFASIEPGKVAAYILLKLGLAVFLLFAGSILAITVKPNAALPGVLSRLVGDAFFEELI